MFAPDGVLGCYSLFKNPDDKTQEQAKAINGNFSTGSPVAGRLRQELEYI